MKLNNFIGVLMVLGAVFGFSAVANARPEAQATFTLNRATMPKSGQVIITARVKNVGDEPAPNGFICMFYLGRVFPVIPGSLAGGVFYDSGGGFGQICTNYNGQILPGQQIGWRVKLRARRDTIVNQRYKFRLRALLRLARGFEVSPLYFPEVTRYLRVTP